MFMLNKYKLILFIVLLTAFGALTVYANTGMVTDRMMNTDAMYSFDGSLKNGLFGVSIGGNSGYIIYKLDKESIETDKYITSFSVEELRITGCGSGINLLVSSDLSEWTDVSETATIEAESLTQNGEFTKYNWNINGLEQNIRYIKISLEGQASRISNVTYTYGDKAISSNYDTITDSMTLTFLNISSPQNKISVYSGMLIYCTGVYDDGTAAGKISVIDNSKITYASDNTSIISIDENGLVTALAEGTANLSASVSIGGKVIQAEPAAVEVVKEVSGVFNDDINDFGKIFYKDSGLTTGVSVVDSADKGLMAISGTGPYTVIYKLDNDIAGFSVNSERLYSSISQGDGMEFYVSADGVNYEGIAMDDIYYSSSKVTNDNWAVESHSYYNISENVNYFKILITPKVNIQETRILGVVLYYDNSLGTFVDNLDNTDKLFSYNSNFSVHSIDMFNGEVDNGLIGGWGDVDISTPWDIVYKSYSYFTSFKIYSERFFNNGYTLCNNIAFYISEDGVSYTAVPDEDILYTYTRIYNGSIAANFAKEYHTCEKLPNGAKYLKLSVKQTVHCQENRILKVSMTTAQKLNIINFAFADKNGNKINSGGTEPVCGAIINFDSNVQWGSLNNIKLYDAEDNSVHYTGRYDPIHFRYNMSFDPMSSGGVYKLIIENVYSKYGAGMDRQVLDVQYNSDNGVSQVDVKAPYKVIKSKENENITASFLNGAGINTDGLGCELKYYSQNPNIITVDEKTGAVCGISSGTAGIYAWCGQDGRYVKSKTQEVIVAHEFEDVITDNFTDSTKIYQKDPYFIVSTMIKADDNTTVSILKGGGVTLAAGQTASFIYHAGKPVTSFTAKSLRQHKGDNNIADNVKFYGSEDGVTYTQIGASLITRTYSAYNDSFRYETHNCASLPPNIKYLKIETTRVYSINDNRFFSVKLQSRYVEPDYIAVTFSDAKGNQITGLQDTVKIDTTIVNTTEAEKDVNVIYALYSNGRLIRTVVSPVKIGVRDKAGDTYNYSAVSNENINKIKVFVWEDFENIIPVRAISADNTIKSGT